MTENEFSRYKEQIEGTDVIGPNEYTNFPASQISWYWAVEYCNWKSRVEGLTPCYTIDKNTPDPNNMFTDDRYKWTVTCDFSADGYRLPTEAEWEYAARGGNQSHGYLYSGSDNVEAVAVCTENDTSSVMSKIPNELGLYDMSGNLYEWCWDWGGEKKLPVFFSDKSYRSCFWYIQEFAAEDAMGVMQLMETSFQTAVFLPVVHTYRALMRQDTVSVSCGQ